MEVTTLREESISDSQFTWPDHYTETEVIPDIEQTVKKSDLQDGEKRLQQCIKSHRAGLRLETPPRQLERRRPWKPPVR